MRVTFHDGDRTPLASLVLDIVSLNDRILALRKTQMEEEIKILNTQARINRLHGALSDLTQRMELKAGSKKAAPGATDAA